MPNARGATSQILLDLLDLDWSSLGTKQQKDGFHIADNLKTCEKMPDPPLIESEIMFDPPLQGLKKMIDPPSPTRGL